MLQQKLLQVTQLLGLKKELLKFFHGLFIVYPKNLTCQYMIYNINIVSSFFYMENQTTMKS